MGISIAIDGPAGAGKSTVAKQAAAKIGFIYVDTGAMYRAIGLYFLRKNCRDEEQIERECKSRNISVTIEYQDQTQQVFLNGENVSSLIRTEEVGKMTSFVSKIGAVRELLLDLQRGLAKENNVIMDGRDIGTHVLPDAQIKIYLTASSKERARRRYEELKEKGADCNIEEIEKDIIVRDEQDMNREIAPLRQAEDAVLLDTSFMEKDEVVEKVVSLYLKAGGSCLNITVAKTAGFCFGVKRAVDMVYEQALTGKRVFTYGPIIHNDEVVHDLEQKGIHVIHSLEELKKQTEGTVIIRSHGVSREVYELLETQGVEIVDATCPFVKKIHDLVKQHSEAGDFMVIIGNENHPEVEGIKGWCSGPVQVIETEEQAEEFTPFDDKNGDNRQNKICIVSQTTFNYKKFQDLVEIIGKKGYDIIALNTICNATEERQTEAENLAKVSDAMIVIGGKHSSNTQKLFGICKRECDDTYYIQTLVDLDLEQFKFFSSVGITAGASTPNNIIKEVTIGMAEGMLEQEDSQKEIQMEAAANSAEGTSVQEASSEETQAAASAGEESFAQLLEVEGTLKTIHNGEVVEGSVIDVKEDEIVLNIGYKSDGIITRSEYTNESNVDLTTKVAVGDTMQAKVLKVNDGEGQVVLTYKRLAAERGNKRLEEAFNNQEVLTAKVAAVLDGGLSVVVDEARIFIPASLVSDTYEQDLSKYAGQEIEFIITEFNPRRRRIIGNRKKLLLDKKEELKRQLFEKISEGMVMEGVVKNVTDFGAFIDLGGADGLLHISEMSWGRVENPKKVFKVGDEVKVLIKEIKGEKIALSRKFDDENPWLNAAEKYAAGHVVTGRVARMTDFGAFVELEPGVDALLHVSQIAKEHIEKPSDVLKTGQEVTAKVVDFNEDARKISLSIKAMLNDQEKEESSEE